MIAIDDTVRGTETGRIGRVVRWWIPESVVVVAWQRGTLQKVGVSNLELVEKAAAVSVQSHPTAREFRNELGRLIGEAS